MPAVKILAFLDLDKKSWFSLGHYLPAMIPKRGGLVPGGRFLRCMIVMGLAACLLLPGFSRAASKEEGFASNGRTVLVRLDDDDIPVFVDDLIYRDLAACLSGSIDYFRKLPAGATIAYGKDRFTAARMIISLQRFSEFIESRPAPLVLSAFIRRHYRVYAFCRNRKQQPVLFTGYYLPKLHGSLTRTQRFAWPVYSRPAGLVEVPGDKVVIGRHEGDRLVPYYTRREIEQTGVLRKTASPIVWVDDPVALFFMQIQGSGTVRLRNGDTLNLQFDVTNGRPYKSIGKYLVDHKKMKKEQVSMPAIKAYLKAHPDEMDEILDYNDRYVFFKRTDRPAVGCYDIELTPGRSIAAGRAVCPPAGLVYMETKKPVRTAGGGELRWLDFSRFVSNQDTGGAITGPGRADIFWGSGPYAETAAGYMKHPGRLFFLVLKPD